MLEKSFTEVYDKFKLHFYRKVFELVRERDGSLSAMEAFSLEVINMLGQPTVGRFAEFLNISQSNATYKVNNLIKKGYLERQNSRTDRREYHLVLSEKFFNYMSLLSSYELTVMQRIRERFPREDVEKFSAMLEVISAELMPECENSGR
ncbi:MAG: MarR family transcriptional regulator [Clostridia bacterium]|nr:MarR family transcriptional regulator [Bacillota bacterium]PWM15429.1 MAG: MarR family transcriptional regulator [Clostridia bacterium]PWM15448.1 MAG: MarR family transcriptional regulator [Clostridia bacterium]